jgi:hypothetical protein
VSIRLPDDGTDGLLRPNFADLSAGWRVTYRLANCAETGEGDSQFSGF